MDVVIADDHKLFAEGLASIVRSVPGANVVAIAHDGDELLKCLLRYKPDICFTDYSMPNKTGVEALREARQMGIESRIVVVSMHDSEGYVIEIIEAGANGFISKNAEPEEIRLAIDSIQANGFYFNELTNKAMLNKMVSRRKLFTQFMEVPVQFSEREIQIIRLLAQEKTSTEIGEILFTSHRTVEDARSAMIKKIGVKNVVGLVLYAYRHNLI